MLLCTTTNKAIDSLAEKIYNCGHRNILAFGNVSRLGATSLQLTLPYRVEAHASVLEVKAFKHASEEASDLWARIKADAVVESADETRQPTGIFGQDEPLKPGPNYSAILRRHLKKHASELQRLMSAANQALHKLQTLPEHPDSVTEFIQGAPLLYTAGSI